MSILEDLGRSNALTSNMQNLASMAINLRQLQNQEEQQGFTNAINMEKLGMEKETHGIELRKAKVAADDAEKQQKILDSPYNITTDPRYLMLPPEAQKATLDHFVKGGFTDSNGVGTVRSARAGLEMLEKNAGAFESAMAPVVQSKRNLVSSLIAKKNELLQNGEPLSSDKIKKLDVAIKSAAVDLSVSSKNYETHLNTLIREDTSQNKLVPVKQADGTVVYERVADAVGKEVGSKTPVAMKVEGVDTRNNKVVVSTKDGQLIYRDDGSQYVPDPNKKLATIRESDIRFTRGEFLKGDDGNFYVVQTGGRPEDLGKIRPAAGGVGTGMTPVTPTPPTTPTAGGPTNFTPGRGRAISEGDKQAFAATSNITEVIPDVKQTLDMRLKSGGPVTNQVTGRIWNAELNAGLDAGVPDEVVKTHAALKHLRTWATGVLKGQGSDEQRKALIETFPEIWDAPRIMQNKILKTMQITRNVMQKRVDAMNKSGQPIPDSWKQEMSEADNFIASLGGINRAQNPKPVAPDSGSLSIEEYKKKRGLK